MSAAFSSTRRLLALAAAASLALVAGTTQPVTAAEPTTAATKDAPAAKSSLKVGDAAPAIQIAEWVKGEPVTGFEKGRIYVVEFWATWCGPCRASIPHLTELAHKYKSAGVTFIGVTSTDKNAEVVKKFVEKMGDQMDYPVAIDMKKGNDGLTDAAYMEASGQQGIPCAFVVDREGKIAWIGHPMSFLEPVLADLAANKFDPKKQQQLEEDSDRLMGEVRAASKDKDWDKALASLDAYSKLHPMNASGAAETKFWMLLRGKKDAKAAYEHANALVDGSMKDDAMSLNELAWRVMDDEGIETRDYDFSLKAAKRAAEITSFNDPMILDTLARAYFEKGDMAKAVEMQTKAIEKADEAEMKDQMKETLEKYQKSAKK